MSIFRHYDAAWWRVHGVAHLLGGVARWAILSLIVWLFTSGHTTLAILATVAYQQGEWERFQREYDPTYPVWSMVGDTILTLAAAVAASLLFRYI